MNNFYVYALCYPDGTPFYIGKGNGNRMHCHEKNARNGTDKKSVIIRGILAGGERILIKVLFETTEEKEAYIEEKKWILEYKPGLCNVNSGGEGRPLVHSSRKKRSHNLAFTDGQWQALQNKAAQKGMDVSSYVIWALKLQ